MRFTAFIFSLVITCLIAADAPSVLAKPRVIATTSIIADWARTIGGDDIDLTPLVGPDGDPHEYQPVPADSLKLAHADVIFENGLGLEPWLDKLCAASRTQATRIVLTQGIGARKLPSEEGGNPNDQDPHAWQDVRDAQAMVQHLCDALAAADPLHVEAYKARAAAYEKQLVELDAYVAAQINSIPPARRKLVTSHDAFGYFGDRYGLQIVGNVLESVTTEAADPSARQIADVINHIKSAGVPVIFLENVQNPKLTNQIAADAGVKVGPPLYSDALGQPGSAGDTYLRMMRYNADAFARSLR